MKKFFALLLSAIMLLGLLAGCSADKEEEEEEKPYEAALRIMMDAMYKGKSDKVADLAPEEYWEYMDDYMGMDEKDAKEQVEERWENTEESWKDEYGKDYKFSYRIKKATKLKSEKLTEIQEAIDERYEFSPKIKAGYELEVKVTIKGSEGSDDGEMTYAAIQIDSKWYIVNVYDNGDSLRVSFLFG